MSGLLSSPTTLTDFNQWTTTDAMKLVTHWCAAPQWANAVVMARPYSSLAELVTYTTARWAEATDADLLSAFAAHPVIGDIDLLRSKYAPQANVEQGQVLQASEQTIQALAEQNIAYRERHGFTFIVFATGKSAEQMLELLSARIDNTTAEERKNAAAEQLKIMQLRLQQSLQENSERGVTTSLPGELPEHLQQDTGNHS